MRALVYSDVHGNLPAFEAMLAKAGDCEMYVCLGDLVNYGPWSNECVDLALSLPNSTLLMGNHEEAFIDGVYPGNSPLVKAFFAKTIINFDRKIEISAFLQDYKLADYLCTHTINNTYIYPDTDISINNNYLIGHSHHQFRYQNNGFTLYNVGSVGQNRKYINSCNFLLYDLDKKEATMENVIYPLDLLIKEMHIQNYSEECINYYMSKAKV